MGKITGNKSKKFVQITKAQLRSIIDAADTLSAMEGVGSDFDPMAKRIVRNIDSFLKKNGYKRVYN